MVKAKTISDAWFQALKAILNDGYVQTIQRGSYEKVQKRLQLPFISGEIEFPLYDMIPQVPFGIPQPTTKEYIEEYFQTKIIGVDREENEEYCYSEDTQVLTNSGWKYFYELKQGDTLATLNLNTNEIKYQLPLDVVSFDHNGVMYHFHSAQIDLLVTPDHKLVYAKNEQNKFSLVKAKKITNQRRIRFKCDGIWNGRKMQYFTLPAISYENRYKHSHGSALKLPMNLWLMFFGAWLADGSLRNNAYTVVITKRKTQERKLFVNVFKKIFPNLFVYEKDILICNKQLYMYLKQFGKAGDKYIPEELLTLPPAQLKILFWWMWRCDGDAREYRYSTKSKRLADNLQELCLKIGKAARLSTDSGIWRVYVSKHKSRLMPHLLTKSNLDTIDYKGKTWCAIVPKYHTLYVRRNGKPVWSGNTYGERIMLQLPTVVDILQKTPLTNQAVIEVAQPSDIDISDPPCLRIITFKCVPHKGTGPQTYDLNVTVFFRSWECWAGLPTNLGGLAMLMQYVAGFVEGAVPGRLFFASDGLHLYDMAIQFAEQKCGQSAPPNTFI